MFVLTEADGRRFIGLCRRFLAIGSQPRYPECICLLRFGRRVCQQHFHSHVVDSHVPCSELLSDLLETIQVRWLLQPGSVFPLLEALVAQPVPPPGGAVSVHIEPQLSKYNRSDDDSLPDPEDMTFRRTESDAVNRCCPLNVPLFFSLPDDFSARVWSCLHRGYRLTA